MSMYSFAMLLLNFLVQTSDDYKYMYVKLSHSIDFTPFIARLLKSTQPHKKPLDIHTEHPDNLIKNHKTS